MKKYLNQIEFAAKSLVELISSDFNKLQSLEEDLKVITPEIRIKHQTFMANEFHPAANFYHAQMAQAFELKNEPIKNEIEALVYNIGAKSVSITALSSALLQIAKQGISITYRKPCNAPKGGDFNGILIKEIVWESRNQANHYENPKEISINVVDLFKRLDEVRNDGVVWEPKSQTNFSFEVIKLLGWLKYEKFVADMSSIRPK